MATRHIANPNVSMESFLRRASAIASLALVGCAGQAAAPPPAVRTTTARMAIADTLHDAQFRAAHSRALAAARGVDTIVVVPSEIRLRVGQALSIERLQVSARSAAGETVAGFAPVYVLASPVASFNGTGLEGRTAGEAELFVEVLPSAPPGVRPRPRPSTRVRIVVEP